MARLPIPGQDNGTWGDILNDYLLVEHNADGTLVKTALIDGAQQRSQKGAPGGYAGLNIDGIIPASQLGSGTADSTTFLRGDGTWATTGGSSVSDADSSTKGIIRLSGDLGGTADSPTVPGLATKAEDAIVVKLTGAQSIDGIKTFADGIVVPDDSIPQAKVNNLAEDLAAKQPIDSDLSAIASLTPSNDDIIQRKAGAWTNRTPVQLKTDLALTKSDVGLSNVDNTSDLDKPISTSTQAALDAKATDNTVVKLTGAQSIDGIKTFNDGIVVPDDSIPQAKINNLAEDLSGKQPLDSDLTSIAGLSASNDDILQRKAGAWTNRTTTQVKADLALVKSDVGLGNVDNTSDANKPISLSTQAALDLKADDDSVVKLTGAQSIDGIKTFTSAPVVPDGSFAQSKVTNLTTDLAAKVPTSRTITAGAGLTGGGDLSANRSIAVDFGDTTGTVAEGDDARITGAIQSSTLTAKGDLLVATGASAAARLEVGDNDQVLVADSAQPTGLKWADAATGGGGSSFLHKANGTGAQVNLDDGNPHSIVPATYTVPGGTFAADGDTVIVWVSGIAYNYSGGTRYFDLVLDVGGVQVARRLDEFNTVSQDNYFEATFRIERRAFNKFRVFSRINRSRFNAAPAASAFGAYIVADFSDRTLDMTQDITIDVLGDSFDAAPNIAIHTQSWSVEKVGAP